MAKRIVAKPAFEPLFSQELVAENLSAESCRNRDINRRIVAIVATKTPEQVLEMAKRNPETTAHMAEIANELQEHTQAEMRICETVFARLVWALEKTGHVELPA